MAEKKLRVVEFYAGIGGFHYALRESGVKGEIIASIDINTNTVKVYAHNFPLTPQLNRNICGMSAAELDKLEADVFFLSPPCQPFTRQGNRLDSKDRRTDSFFHLMHTMRDMRRLPSYLLMENVKGFETSQTRDEFVGILWSLDYNVQEFLLTPHQFGVPNSRLRFFLLAKRKPLTFKLQMGEGESCSNPSDQLVKCVAIGLKMHNPSPVEPGSEHWKVSGLELKLSEMGIKASRDQASAQKEPNFSPVPESKHWEASSLEQKSSEKDMEVGTTAGQVAEHYPNYCKPLSCYLEDLSEEKRERYLVPDKILQKYAIAMDIVSAASRHSCCFTKAYGNYAVGTGSILQHSLDDSALKKAFEEFSKCQEVRDFDGSVQCLRELNLRYFSPREVANLMCFPADFSFPPGLTDKQCYKALGNSLNVTVVSVLIQYLFS